MVTTGTSKPSGDTGRRTAEKFAGRAWCRAVVGGVELRAVRVYFQRVAFVFADFLNLFAGVVGVNRQRGLLPLVGLASMGSRFSGETRGEALRGGVRVAARCDR